MKALFYRYHSICEPDMKAGFEKIGIHMDELRLWELGENVSSGEMVRGLGERLLEGRYHFVFSVNFFPEVSEVCERVGIPYVCYIVDCPVLELYHPAVKNSCNFIFSFDYALYEELVGTNPGGIYYLPLAAASERLAEVCKTITAEERIKYQSDVTFIGSLYSEKCTYNKMEGASEYLKGYLDSLIETQLGIYGMDLLEIGLTPKVIEEFKKCVPFYQLPENSVGTDAKVMSQFYLGNKVTEQERLRKFARISEKFSMDLYTLSDTSMLPNVHVKGSAESMVEMPKIFNCSKININLTSKPIRTGIPQRIFDIMGAGGFVLTNYQSELQEYFTMGEHLDCFGSDEEMMEKIAYYLEHDDERARIAKNGKEWVAKNHTYDLRAAIILDTVFGE